MYQSKGIQLLFHVHTKILTTREEHSYRNLSPISGCQRGDLNPSGCLGDSKLFVLLSCGLYLEVSMLSSTILPLKGKWGRETRDDRTVSKSLL